MTILQLKPIRNYHEPHKFDPISTFIVSRVSDFEVFLSDRTHDFDNLQNFKIIFLRIISFRSVSGKGVNLLSKREIRLKKPIPDEMQRFRAKKAK